MVNAKMKKSALLLLACFLLLGCGQYGETVYDKAIVDGVAHLNRNKPEKALEDFNRAIKLDPNQAGGYVGRGNTLNTLGQYEKAIRDYENALAIDPNIANAYVNRGIAYSHLGQFKKAIADYEKGLELNPKIDNKPGIMQRLFTNTPIQEKGIRRHLEYLKTIVEQDESTANG